MRWVLKVLSRWRRSVGPDLRFGAELLVAVVGVGSLLVAGWSLRQVDVANSNSRDSNRIAADAVSVLKAELEIQRRQIEPRIDVKAVKGGVQAEIVYGCQGPTVATVNLTLPVFISNSGGAAVSLQSVKFVSRESSLDFVQFDFEMFSNRDARTYARVTAPISVPGNESRALTVTAIALMDVPSYGDKIGIIDLARRVLESGDWNFSFHDGSERRFKGPISGGTFNEPCD